MSKKVVQFSRKPDAEEVSRRLRRIADVIDNTFRSRNSINILLGLLENFQQELVNRISEEEIALVEDCQKHVAAAEQVYREVLANRLRTDQILFGAARTFFPPDDSA